MLHGRPSSSLRVKESIEAFRTAVQIAPQHAETHMKLLMQFHELQLEAQDLLAKYAADLAKDAHDCILWQGHQ